MQTKKKKKERMFQKGRSKLASANPPGVAEDELTDDPTP